MDKELKLKAYISILRSKYNIPIFPEDVPCLCNECDLENMRFADLYDYGYEHIRLSIFGINHPFHRASLIGFNTDKEQKWFLVDPTYGQFFKKNKFAEYMSYYHTGFSIELLEEGYIECTLENMLAYVDGFVNSGAYTKKLNNDMVTQKVKDFLIEKKIIKDNKKKSRKRK